MSTVHKKIHHASEKFKKYMFPYRKRTHRLPVVKQRQCQSEPAKTIPQLEPIKTWDSMLATSFDEHQDYSELFANRLACKLQKILDSRATFTSLDIEPFPEQSPPSAVTRVSYSESKAPCGTTCSDLRPEPKRFDSGTAV